MFSFDVLLSGNPIVVKIDNEFEELVFVVAPLENNFDPSIPGRNMPGGLFVMLLLEEGDHLFFGWLQKSDDPKVRVLPPKMRADNPRSLRIALI